MGIETAVMAAAAAATATKAASATASALGTGAKILGENRALDAAKDAHAQNTALFHEMFGKAQGWLEPYVDRGNTAGDAYMSLLGFGDPKAAQAGFDRYLDSTGYKFQLAQGVDALNTKAANARMLNSGANLKNITRYGQDIGRQYFDSYLGKLGAPQQLGLSGASSLANLAHSFSSLGASNNNRLAGERGASWRNGAKHLADGLGDFADIVW